MISWSYIVDLESKTRQIWVDLESETKQNIVDLESETKQNFVDLESETKQNFVDLESKTKFFFVDSESKTKQDFCRFGIFINVCEWYMGYIHYEIIILLQETDILFNQTMNKKQIFNKIYNFEM